MKRLLLIVILAMLSSCDYFNKKKIDTKEILDEELKSINWNDVDEYPTFTSCDSSDSKKTCFEAVLRDQINDYLSKQIIVVTEDISDTILLKIHIDNKGNFTLKNIVSSEMTKAQIPQLDSLLRHSFDSLPKIYPAIKRSQQVATEFNLPVVVRIK
jgi:hypothetical protein